MTGLGVSFWLIVFGFRVQRIRVVESKAYLSELVTSRKSNRHSDLLSIASRKGGWDIVYILAPETSFQIFILVLWSSGPKYRFVMQHSVGLQVELA
jgi:hypothetical protein